MITKIGIIGARTRNENVDFILTYKLFMALIESYQESDIMIVSGGCKIGGDHFAELISSVTKIPIRIHYPDCSGNHRMTKYEYRVACFERNTLIANDSDLLIAVVAHTRSKTGGTEDTIKKFRKKLQMTEPEAIEQRKLFLV